MEEPKYDVGSHWVDTSGAAITIIAVHRSPGAPPPEFVKGKTYGSSGCGTRHAYRCVGVDPSGTAALAYVADNYLRAHASVDSGVRIHSVVRANRSKFQEVVD